MGLFSKLFARNKYNPKASNYRMNTLEEIESIPVPTEKFEYNCDFTESIEYVLQRKATQFKKDGKLDLAIACLRKSNEIMPYAPMIYSTKDYARLEEYLKLAKKFDEARVVKEGLQTSNTELSKLQNIQKERVLPGEMIEVHRDTFVCGECAKYARRIYSPNGEHGYPDINIFLNYYHNKKCDCLLSYYTYFYGISEPRICDEGKSVEFSNRPFVDDRTIEEKTSYEAMLLKKQTLEKDRSDYDWVCEHLPDVAPKSFGGYRNMKNKNSPNYQKIVSVAKEHGYTI